MRHVVYVTLVSRKGGIHVNYLHYIQRLQDFGIDRSLETLPSSFSNVPIAVTIILIDIGVQGGKIIYQNRCLQRVRGFSSQNLYTA